MESLAAERKSQGRLYVHVECERATLVTGRDWIGLCNPFAQTMGTICSHCGRSYGLKHFVWQDSGANLQTYVRRLRKMCPLFWRMWFWWSGPISGAVVGASVLHFVGPSIPVENQLPSGAWDAIGAFFGVFLIPYLITPWLCPHAVGIEFHREQ